MPDEMYGEKVWAGVVLKDGAKLTEAEIRDRVKDKLSKVRALAVHTELTWRR